MTVSTLLDREVWNGKAFTGSWVSLAETRPLIEPATGETLGDIAIASAADIAKACAAAAAAQGAWAATPYEERATILRKAAAATEAHSEEIVNWMVRETGSIIPKAQFEVGITIRGLHEASAMPSQSQGEILPTQPGQLSLARRRPLGVVGVIAPFNFPLYLAIRAVAPALALGNTVVLKPDSRTAVSGAFAIARIFEEAGLPAGVLQVLPGDVAAGEQLCIDPNIALIQFTGSTAAGRKVGELAGKHLKKVSLELGGKNSLIILEDADIPLAITNTKWSAYLHQGQICMAGGRILVHESIAEAFSQALSEAAAQLPVGNPTTGKVALGPLISQSQADNASKLVADSVAAGANLLTGGDADGLFFKPTVLTNVKKGMPAYDQEVFAPVALITTFSSDEEAIALANDSEFGLSAAVITNDLQRALAITEELHFGLVHINDQTVADDVINPFGGVGDSGNGTSIGGPANMELFTHWQWMTIKGAAPPYPI